MQDGTWRCNIQQSLGPFETSGGVAKPSKGKSRKKSHKLAFTSISQEICKRAIDSGICLMQDVAWRYNIQLSLGPFRTSGGVAKP